MQTDLDYQELGVAGAAGYCQHCARRTSVHVVGVGPFCATHYVAYVEFNNAPITPQLLKHYQELSQHEPHLTMRAADICPRGGFHDLGRGVVYGVEVEICKKCGKCR
jgi:hypothetical protein